MSTRNLTKLLRVADIWRQIDPLFGLQQSMLLLEARRHMLQTGEKTVSQTALGKALSMPQTSVSRNIAILAGLERRGPADRPVLVRIYEDPMDRRQKLVEFTAVGLRLMGRIEQIMED